MTQINGDQFKRLSEKPEDHRCCPSHCCLLHNCKYGYDDCPVVTGEVWQEYICETCSNHGIKSVEEIHELWELREITDDEKKNALRLGLEKISDWSYENPDRKDFQRMKIYLDALIRHINWATVPIW